jgi:predicted AlkP superfamily pyrophosphatase or phosphodiesterase
MSKLLCVLIDGLRADALSCAHVGSFNRLIQGGVLARSLQAVSPQQTLPALLSLFTSLPPEEHGIVTNSSAAVVAPHAVSLFSLLRYRQQNSAAFYSNDRLRLLFPPGSLHTGMCINSQGVRNVDRELAEQAALHLQREKPDLCFLYLEGSSITGVHLGFLSEPYLESIEQADRCLGLLVEHLTMVGLQQEYTLMVLGTPGGYRPRTGEEEGTRFPLLLAGPGIAQGVELDAPLSLLDLAPTMARILGLAPHPDWRGSVVEGVFRRPQLELMAGEQKKRAQPKRRQHGLAA